MESKQIAKKGLKIIGWLLVIITIGPIGLSFQLIADPSPGGLIFISVFVFFFGLGIWLIRKGKKVTA